MLAQAQVHNFILKNYKDSILRQIPPQYQPEETLITINLKLDLTKIFRTQKAMGAHIISNFPLFQKQSLSSIHQLFLQEGFHLSSHGIHLMVSILNCPLPMQNLRSMEFQAAAIEQKEGVMVYLKQIKVKSIQAPEMFLFSCEEVWGARCCCSEGGKVMKVFQQNFLDVVRNNSLREQNRDKLWGCSLTEKPTCEACSKPYQFIKRYNEIYLNCQKITVFLPKGEGNEGIFDAPYFQFYTESQVIKNLRPGALINCCSYIFCRHSIQKAVPKQLISSKIEYSSYLISYYEHEHDQNKLLLRSQNSKFFSSLSQLRVEQEQCANLTAFDTLLSNYNNLVEGIDRIKFAYLSSQTLTTLKLALLNSIFNHYQNQHLHLCIIVQDLLMIYRALRINDLITVKTWPSEYDSNTIVTWFQANNQAIVILMNPSKKDFQLLERILQGKFYEKCGVTVWVVCEKNPKKQFNLDHFGVVLDFTVEKNKLVCQYSLEQMLDTKLSAFLTEEPEQDCFPTIARLQKPNARMRLLNPEEQIEEGKVMLEERQQEEAISKEILQKYYLKSRDLKKTTSSTLNYLCLLARGFASLRSCLQGEDWYSKDEESVGSLTILDVILTIFLDEESARHKFSNCNTIFGTEISKLILNENACEISFWGVEEMEEGIFREEKHYLPKGEMFKRVLYRLNSLIYENDLAYCDD